MVESQDIRRFDFEVPLESGVLDIRMAVVRLWDDAKEDSCSRFNIQMKLRNEKAEDVVEDEILEGGTWTVVAHSDHNPTDGHNIRDSADQKQLHVDVHPHIAGQGYNKVYIRICDGNPPETNEEAIGTVKSFMKQNADTILQDYIQYF
jgi:hypothetical protein